METLYTIILFFFKNSKPFYPLSKKTLKNILLTEIFASTFLLIFMPFRYLVKLNILSVGIITLLSIVLFFLLMKWSYRINKEKYEKIKMVSLICFVGIMTQLCVIYLMKLMWSRVRFFELDENYTSFTRWFVINWFEGNGTSFPSGHTSGATNIMYLTLFTPLFTEDKKKHWLVEGFCFLFITLTAFSRMVLGKHYLSDVTMAFAITYVIHIIVSKSIIDRQKKKKSI